MKKVITPLNVARGNVVEFAVPDFDPIRNFPISVGTKAKFIEWNQHMEAVLLIPENGIVITNPDIIVVES